MIILSYNINKFTQEKLDRVLQYDADVFILPEVACPSFWTIPLPMSRFSVMNSWHGTEPSAIMWGR